MEVPIEDLVFMDSDNIVFTEGVDEYEEKYKRRESIEPITIFYQKK